MGNAQELMSSCIEGGSGHQGDYFVRLRLNVGGPLPQVNHIVQHIQRLFAARDGDSTDGHSSNFLEDDLHRRGRFYAEELFRQRLNVLAAVGPNRRGDTVRIQCFDHVAAHGLFLIVQESVGLRLMCRVSGSRRPRIVQSP